MFHGILLILLGLLAVPSLVLAKRPDAKALFDKIAPFQGIIGIIFVILGLWWLIDCLRFISFISLIPIYWFTWLLVALVSVALGLILGYGLISKYALSRNEQAAAKGAALMQRLLPLQGKLGLLAVALGIWMIIAHLIFYKV